nr:UDP-glucuronic acid decarboxylase 6-like [Ipomoea batatas]
MDGHPRLSFIRMDVTEKLFVEVTDLSLACPLPRFSTNSNSVKEFCVTSTSEVIWRSLVQSQEESYWGTLTPIGNTGLEYPIAENFNTYGPRMNIDDGRVAMSALTGPVARNSNAKSFCYVSDMSERMASNGRKPPPEPSPLRKAKFFQDQAFTVMLKVSERATLFPVERQGVGLTLHRVGPSPANMRILVTGGAGFIGSHLVDKLMQNEKNEVIVVDNYFTGSKDNLKQWIGHPRFELIRHDVTEKLFVEVDRIYHLACPASPIFYKYNPVKTIKTNVIGTLNMLGLAKRVGARILLTSTSEVYGDPLVHPQEESYWGNVNPIGVRSCYDEGKRVAETLMFDYHRQHGIEIRIARIFNTYGPRMNIDDGRVVSNFIAQAIRDEPLTVQLPGTQTRSFCYVSDMVDGLIRLMEGENTGPINIGNPGEFTMLELAETVKEMINPNVKIMKVENTPDDPRQRKPDITKAKALLGWEPKVKLRNGIPLMEEDFRTRLGIQRKS